MGWDKGGRYYTRSHKVNGRVVREYIGGGLLGELAARRDAIDRQDREAERAERKAVQAEMDARDALVNDLNDVADLLAHAALLAAGYHRHKRGQWRKKRVRRDDTR
jgi:hypothetical protein